MGGSQYPHKDTPSMIIYMVFHLSHQTNQTIGIDKSQLGDKMYAFSYSKLFLLFIYFLKCILKHTETKNTHKCVYK